ncbi:tail fiber [Staphylococcus phage vB_SauP-V4SA02]|nr:tail fiber [Staphylococcus phage vB_SauP-V4SA02]
MADRIVRSLRQVETIERLLEEKNEKVNEF